MDTSRSVKVGRRKSFRDFTFTHFRSFLLISLQLQLQLEDRATSHLCRLM
jgi:hypothetical protein